ncbi:ABC transporter permease [Halococcus sp. AFM35]|uniref:ABC transporter permease n=1 Tax=Halococcus sp. AFM35 TaxID=3421653 RepID=UPI003EBFA7F7
MSTLAVARKDFRDALRSRVLLGLTGLFVLFVAGASYFFARIQPQPGTGGDPTALVLIFSLLTPASLFVPILGLALGYKAVAGERESGRIKLLLSLPHSRLDVVLGKALGRTGVLVVPVVVGFAVGAAVIFWQSSRFTPVNYVAFAFATVLLGLAYIAIGVAISSATTSTFRALIGGLSLLAVLEFLWRPVRIAIVYLVNGLSLPQQAPGDWYFFLQTLPPGSAYSNAARSLLPKNPTTLAITGPTPDAFYLQDWFGFVILAVWIIVPLALGYRRFERTDL